MHSGYPKGPVPEDSRPHSYLCLSIFSTLFCFVYFGRRALYQSRETRRYCEEGHLGAAELASKSARKYNLIAIGVGIPLNIIFLGLTAAVIYFAVTNN